MQPTRRGWVILITPAVLLLLGVLLASPVVIASVGVLLAVILTVAVQFVWRLQALPSTVTVDRTVTPTPAYEQQPIQLRTHVTIDDNASRDICQTIRQSLPLAADHREGTLLTDVDRNSSITQAVTLAFDVAGHYTLSPLEVVCQDSYGWFTTTIRIGTETEVEVTPAVPNDVTVGQGTERIAIGGTGEEDLSHGSGGIEPEELRPYQPGDPHARIDWKTTARLGEVFVREFKADTDVETLIILDQRATGTADVAGRTQLDYLREVALWLVEQAQSQERLIGLRTVDEDGVTEQLPVTSGPEHYRTLIRRLFDLESQDVATGETPSRVGVSSATIDPERLTENESAFVATLRPYAEQAEAYVHRVERDPLFATVRTTLGRMSADPHLVILTTDAYRAELVETTKQAARQSSRTTLFIAPKALFGNHALIDRSQAYRDYVDFESFRRQLHGMRDVTAYDIGPARQVNAVLREADQERAQQ